MPDYSITLTVRVRINARDIKTAQKTINYLTEVGHFRAPAMAGAEDWGTYHVKHVGKPRIVRFERSIASCRSGRAKRNARRTVMLP